MQRTPAMEYRPGRCAPRRRTHAGPASLPLPGAAFIWIEVAKMMSRRMVRLLASILAASCVDHCRGARAARISSSRRRKARTSDLEYVRHAADGGEALRDHA
jgi:hypothetical protein